MQTNEQTTSAKPGPLDFLKTQPQFLQMRRVVRENPHLLSAVLKKIEDTNPSLLKLITDNKDEFLRIMNEENSSPANDVRMSRTTQAAVQTQTHFQPPSETQQTTPTPVQSPRTTITVTSQEKEAIERLKALGFTEHMVLQAYFACDKNELQAADFLLSQDDDTERPGDG
jgi:UV excision repair protein RAD23